MILTDICCFNFVRIEYFHLSEQEPENILVRKGYFSTRNKKYSKNIISDFWFHPRGKMMFREFLFI